ncbi:MAG: iron-containing alcohol dehydrogenase [Verrucomicrobiales bacterium]|nr:iron-containing alcohol dehydrogenase [Verrucomicrobiales bacterium]
MNFEFATGGRILFGAGRIRELPGALERFGRRALVITGQNAERSAPMLKLLRSAGISTVLWPIAGEPTVDLVRAGAAFCRDEGCDFAISFGGGSVIDAGKAIAALHTNTDDVLEYLEVIGRGKPLSNPAAPFVAIPTTAGTGTEVTRNAVLGSPEHRVKASLRSALMLPRLALVDPALTYDLPPELTASTGLDALTQLIEPFVSRRANAITDAICREGMRRVARSLRRAFENGGDTVAREDMALAALLGGLALANAGLGAVHGFAAPIGGMFPAPHGAVCAALLPHVIAVNVRALREREAEGEALRRFDEVARLLTGRDDARADDAVRWTGELCGALSVSPLRAYGVSARDFPSVVEKASAASSMKSNPLALTPLELDEILERAT